MRNKVKGVLIALFATAALGNVQAQSENKTKFGKGIQFVAADSSFSVKIGARFQTLYQGSSNPATKEWDDRFLIRRARLKFDGFAYSPKLEYKIELGLSNSDIGNDTPEQTNNADNIILDAVARWQMTPTLSLWAGQTKLPGNRERVVSSQKMQFVDRSLLNSRFNLDRDAGLQLHNEHQVGTVILREIGSISMGEGRDITVNNSGGYDYTARFEILPLGAFKGDGDYVGGDLEREQTPKLAIAATYDYNDNAAREQGQLGDFLSAQRDLRTVFVDAMFKYRGFSSMAEYANRKAPDGAVVALDSLGNVEEAFTTGNAFNIQAGYLFPANWEIAGRYTNYEPTAGIGQREQQQYTLGLSKYLVGHSLKVQSDFTLQQEQNRDDRYQFRLQMELAF
ncbi:porin [Pontibacter ruber]|uniref:Porin n=1 Tax=Pontibacter ruber TaxID=1343895 RepID=A0ABW5CXK5_9BACT|nr:porin [Pontibacter ruber]